MEGAGVMSAGITHGKGPRRKTSRETESPCSRAHHHEKCLSATVRRCGRFVADVAKATLAALVFEDRRIEIACGKLRPHAWREHELCIGALPEEKIAEPFFAARSNEEIDIGNATRCVRRSGDRFRELLACERTA